MTVRSLLAKVISLILYRFDVFLFPTTLHPFVHRRQDGLDMHGWRPTPSVHAGIKDDMEIRGGLAGSINERYLEAMDRRSGGHTDRRTYGQTVRGSGVQAARRQYGLRMSKAAYDDLKRSDAAQDDLIRSNTGHGDPSRSNTIRRDLRRSNAV